MIFQTYIFRQLWNASIFLFQVENLSPTFLFCRRAKKEILFIYARANECMTLPYMLMPINLWSVVFPCVIYLVDYVANGFEEALINHGRHPLSQIELYINDSLK